MGFRLNIPLPGPISYSHRIGGRRSAAGHGAIWVLLIGIWWVPTVWLIKGLVWTALFTWDITKYLVTGRTPRT